MNIYSNWLAKFTMKVKGYNDSSCLPVFGEIENYHTKIEHREKDEKEPCHELQWMRWPRPTINTLSLVQNSRGRGPRRSRCAIGSMNRSHYSNRECQTLKSLKALRLLSARTGQEQILSQWRKTSVGRHHVCRIKQSETANYTKNINIFSSREP